jgi:hypothetical protein
MEIKVKTARHWIEKYINDNLTPSELVQEFCKERDEAIAKLQAEIKDWEDRDFDAYCSMKEGFLNG